MWEYIEPEDGDYAVDDDMEPKADHKSDARDFDDIPF